MQERGFLTVPYSLSDTFARTVDSLGLNDTGEYIENEKGESVSVTIRYAFELDVETAQEVLNAVGGEFHSTEDQGFISSIIKKSYSENSVRDFMKSLYDSCEGNKCKLDFSFQSKPIICEARYLSKDGNYAPINALNRFHPLDMIYWSIIDTCITDRDDAVLCLYEEHKMTKSYSHLAPDTLRKAAIILEGILEQKSAKVIPLKREGTYSADG